MGDNILDTLYKAMSIILAITSEPNIQLNSYKKQSKAKQFKFSIL